MTPPSLALTGLTTPNSMGGDQQQRNLLVFPGLFIWSVFHMLSLFFSAFITLSWLNCVKTVPGDNMIMAGPCFAQGHYLQIQYEQKPCEFAACVYLKYPTGNIPASRTGDQSFNQSERETINQQTLKRQRFNLQPYISLCFGYSYVSVLHLYS